MLFAKKKNEAYLQVLDTRNVFDNTTKTALAQTVVAKIIQKHFEQSGGKTPKALIMGFDGARADTMQLLCKSENEKVTGTLFTSAYSAVQALKQAGGLYLSFAGGLPDNPQETSTAQGWSAILTGVWGDDNGVKKHVPLRTDCPTVLRSLAENGKKVAFLAEWDDHFTITYKEEIRIAKEKNLPLCFNKYADDEALTAAFSQQIAQDADCIFGIFEAPDYNGHKTCFTLKNHRYAASVLRLDNVAYGLMEQVRARETFAQEDWLFLITSDHGGHGHGHGTQLMYDRMTFLATNKPVE